MRTFCAVRNKVEDCNGLTTKKVNRKGYLRNFLGGLYSLRAAPMPRRCFALCFGFAKALAEQSAPFALVSKLPDTNWLDYHGLRPWGLTTKKVNRKG